MNTMQKILLLEDDKSLSRGITLTLEKAGYSVDSAFTLKEAAHCLEQNQYSLVICDITLPDGSGLELGRRIRQGSNVYLIYLTALDSETDIVNGYDAGADDYMTKPFSLMVLVSKVNALMRRIDSTEEAGHVLACGDLEVNCREMKVYRDGQEVPLSKKELQLLLYLMENAGHIVSKENILEHIWDVDGQFIDDNTVTVNISRLKNKLGTNKIFNVRGLGYLWNGTVIQR